MVTYLTVVLVAKDDQGKMAFCELVIGGLLAKSFVCS